MAISRIKNPGVTIGLRGGVICRFILSRFSRNNADDRGWAVAGAIAVRCPLIGPYPSPAGLEPHRLHGVVGVRFIGIAAAVGLVLFFIGAVTAHLRARVYDNIAFPGTYLLLAAASLALTVAH